MKKKTRMYLAPTAPIPAATTLRFPASQQPGLVLAIAQPGAQQVCAALRGQCILIVGGELRPAAVARLRQQLGLAAVQHCATREGDASPRTFARTLETLDPLLVIWVSGLSRTAHGQYLHARCRELGIPHVDCRRIPHPDRLVTELLRLRLLSALHRRRFALQSSAARGGGGAA